MNFSTFTVPCDQAFYIYDESPALKQVWTEIGQPAPEPVVQAIPVAFMSALLTIVMTKNLSSEEAWHYAAKVLEEASK